MPITDHPQFRQALLLLDRDRPEDALEVLTVMLDEYPCHPELHLQRGKARGAVGDLVGAADDYARAIEEGHRDTVYEAFFRRGLVLVEQLRLEEGIEDLSSAMELRPDLMGPVHHRGWARYLQGDFAGALDDCTALLRRRPDHAATWFLRGRARFDQEDFDGAMADFLVTLIMDEDHPEAAFQFQLTVDVATRCEKRGSETANEAEATADWAGCMARAEARKAQGDHVGAIADFYAALRHRIGCPQARLGIALSREALQHEAAARVAADRIEQAPSDTRFFVRRADALRRLGKSEDACAVLLAARRVNPADPEVHAELGITLVCWLRDPAGGLPHLDEALRQEPNHIEARRHRALVRRELGRLAEAVSDFDMLEQLIPGDRTLHLNRGLAHEAAGDWESAERDYGLGLRVTPDNDGLLWKRACARLVLGRYADAREDLERALDVRPELALALAGKLPPDPPDPPADLEAALTAYARLRPDAVPDYMAELRGLAS